MTKQHKPIKVTKILVENYLEGAELDVKLLIEDLNRRLEAAHRQGFVSLYLCESYFDDETTYYNLVAERDETKEETAERLAKNKAVQQRLLEQRKKQSAKLVAARKKELVKLAKQLPAEEVVAALEAANVARK